MLQAIDRSIPLYISSINCYAAFGDAIGKKVHFPATSEMVLHYTSAFSSYSTMQQYLKHLRWARRFLQSVPTVCKRLGQSFSSPSFEWIEERARPAKKASCIPSKSVRKLVAEAQSQGDIDVAALPAIGRSFLWRIPSEGIPLGWDGEICVSFRNNLEYRIL